MEPLSFDEYLGQLAPIAVAPTADPVVAAEIAGFANRIEGLERIDRASLTSLVADEWQVVPVLALVVGLGQEALRGFLQNSMGTASWRKAARQDPVGLIDRMDDEFELVNELIAQRNKAWTFGDVLVARQTSRNRAAAGIGRGRIVEDQVEAVVTSLGLPYEMRTRFIGRDDRDAPCDLAIPVGGKDAVIVCAAKGFDSTGSKLSDAVGEIRSMAAARRPSQYVFAVVDGIGWQRRKGDLKRIHELHVKHDIDGVYTLSLLDHFKADLADAAKQKGLMAQ